jgi:hypothetical protein
MTAIITDKFRLESAKLFLDSVSDTDNTNLYIFIGKPLSWDVDLSPDVPTDTQDQNNLHFNDMLSLKKVGSDDAVRVIPRYNWTTGTVYDQYDSRVEDIFDSVFYVLNSNNEVHKCLYVPKNPDTWADLPSTEEPDGVGVTALTYDDGYIWKYMFTISAQNANEFLTPDWIPVETNATVSQNEIDTAGKIEAVMVTERGSNINTYRGGLSAVSNIENGSITLRMTPVTDVWTDNVETSNVCFANGTITVLSGDSAGEIRAISGYDYTTGVVSYTGDSLELNYETDTVVVGPTITISGNGSGAIVYPIIDATLKKVNTIEVLENGSGYTLATIEILGSGAVLVDGESTVQASVMISPRYGHGYDPEKELGGKYVMLKTMLVFDDNEDIIKNNEYRKIGLIRNVLDPDTEALLTAETLSASKSLILASGSSVDWLADDVIVQTVGDVESKAYVIEFDSTSNTLRYIQNDTTGYGTFTTGQTITDDATPATKSGEIEDDMSTSNYGMELMQYAGDILYIEQRRPVVRSPEQTEDIRIVIEF